MVTWHKDDFGWKSDNKAAREYGSPLAYRIFVDDISQSKERYYFISKQTMKFGVKAMTGADGKVMLFRTKKSAEAHARAWTRTHDG